MNYDTDSNEPPYIRGSNYDEPSTFAEDFRAAFGIVLMPFVLCGVLGFLSSKGGFNIMAVLHAIALALGNGVILTGLAGVAIVALALFAAGRAAGRNWSPVAKAAGAASSLLLSLGLIRLLS